MSAATQVSCAVCDDAGCEFCPGVIEVALVCPGGLGHVYGRALAPDMRSAVVAARTLWDDMHGQPYMFRPVLVFSVAGKVAYRMEVRP